MEKKKGLILFLSSAMLYLWACAEGDVVNADDTDELVKNALLEKDEYDFVKPFMEYCDGKKGCETEFIRSSSSSAESSSSEDEEGVSSNSEKNSSSSGKGNSSAKSSSSGKSSSSVKGGSSSSSKNGESSSSAVPTISGKCEVVAPKEIHIGDEVIWRYAPDEGSIASASFEWDVSNEVENGIISGDLTGTGTPQITVVFKKLGKKYGPMLTFGGVLFDCKEEIRVVEASSGPNSSSVESSSSSAPKSSSSSRARSSSSSVKGYCAVSKRVAYVGEEVDWYVVDAEGNEIEGKYNWLNLGDSGELVAGTKEGRGSTRITVKYSKVGTKETRVQYGTQSLMCDTDNNADPWLKIELAEVSSSDAAEESSSSEETVESSSSVARSSSSSRVIEIID